MKKLMMVIAAAVAAVSGMADEINLRDWLTINGVAATNCVIGVDYHADYGPKKLFDGVTNSTDTSARWLGGESSVSNASVTIEIPESAFLYTNVKLVLKRIRLWRNLDSSGVQRAPTTWAIFGSKNGTDWTELQRQSAAVTWDNNTKSFEVALPDNVEHYRYIKFQPLTTTTTYVWKVGLQEIEYFVEEIGKGVNLREWLTNKGVAVADCVSGGAHHASYGPEKLFNGVNTVYTTKATAQADRWLADEPTTGDPTAFVTIAAPDSLFGGDVDGLVLCRYRIYRYSLLSDDYAIWRAPARWIIYGSNDGETWEIVDNHSEAANWMEPGIRYLDYVEYEVPASGRKAYRQFKFKPTKSRYEWDPPQAKGVDWRYGAMELEYFVEEAAPVVNLRDWLTTKGATATVTGTAYNSSYGPERLFDGSGMNGDQNASAYRWLAGQKSIDDVSVTIEVPQSALSAGKKGLALRGVRLWRNVTSDATTAKKRGPKTWVVYGSNNGTDWMEIYRHDSAVEWNAKNLLDYAETIPVPDTAAACRYFKFRPLTSDYEWDWKVGLQELEYFVSEVAADTVVVCGSLGDGVGEVSSGYGRVAGLSSGDSLTVTATSPSCADGVKYEATGYTLETSADGGVTWGAATSYGGTSATVAYDGTPTRITWQWSPIAYKLNAHADEGNETVTVSPASVDGYYDAGTVITVTAAGATSPTITTFREWDVAPEGAVANGATISFTMPAAPTEVNASFARPWTYIAQRAIAGYPKYGDYAAVTDGNWLFVVGSRDADAVSDEKYFALRYYVEGSGRLDLTTLYSDLEAEGTRLYPMRGVRSTVMYDNPAFYSSWRFGRPKVTSVIVPSDIWDVDGNAFRACSNLTSVVLNGTLEKWNILTSGAAGAFKDCPALTNATLHGVTTLPHHIFAGSAPEVIFDGNPPVTARTGWADDWSLAIGCPRERQGAWRSDARFTALSNVEGVASKPNYATMVERYGRNLIGTWDGKWIFRYGEPLGTKISFR